MIDLTNPVEELLEAGLTPGRTNLPHPVVLDCDWSKGTVILQKSCQNTFISKEYELQYVEIVFVSFTTSRIVTLPENRATCLAGCCDVGYEIQTFLISFSLAATRSSKETRRNSSQ